jgi:CBS domain-containing protein
MSISIRKIIGKREKHSVDLAQPIRLVIEYMHERNVGAVAVCDGDKVVGVFSERDLLRRVVHEGLDLSDVNVCDVMTSPAYWISLDERYEVAKAIMVDKGLHHLVVLDEQRCFRGFVSSRELLEADLSDSRDLVAKLNDDYYEPRYKP